MPRAYLVVDNYPVGLVRVVLGNLIAREYRGGSHFDEDACLYDEGVSEFRVRAASCGRSVCVVCAAAALVVKSAPSGHQKPHFLCLTLPTPVCQLK